MYLECSKCGDSFEWEQGPKGGRQPINCPKCRKPRGLDRNREANIARKNARRRAQGAGGEALRNADEVLTSEKMAVGLSLYPDDPRLAAEVVGLAIADGIRLAEVARARHPELVEGDITEFGRRAVATANLIGMRLHRAILAEEISPRDLPHAGRALTQMHEALVGKPKQTFSELHMYLVGADGQPFDPNEVPQPAQPLQEPDAPIKH